MGTDSNVSNQFSYLMITQLPLNLSLRDESTFERFIPGLNQELLSVLQSPADTGYTRSIFLTGANAVGKTHLLQAASRLASFSLYLPLKNIDAYSIGIFNDFAVADLVCLDDINCLASDTEMELALFNLINQMREQGTSFIFSSPQRPDQCGFCLKDLVSRLNACTQYPLYELDDVSKREYLANDANLRGLVFGDGVLDWILAHTPRDMHSLSALMALLDHESLAAQRRITVPFLKEIIK